MQYLDHLAREFDRHFGRSLPAITPPDPVDELEAAEGVAALEPAPLTGLSLCRCSRYGVPHVPDDAERLAAFLHIWALTHGPQFNPAFPAGRTPRPAPPAPAG